MSDRIVTRTMPDSPDEIEELCGRVRAEHAGYMRRWADDPWRDRAHRAAST